MNETVWVDESVAAMWAQDNASEMLGMTLVSVATASAVVSMVVRQDMVNGHSSCHGGMIFSLADTAFAFACNAQDQPAVAGGCNIDFLRPAFRNDQLTATAEVIHQGGRNGLYEVIVANQNKQVVAVFSGRSIRVKNDMLSKDSS